MAVFRVERTQNYTIMSNYHLRDKSISLKAKGLLSQMLSLPEDWDYTLTRLAKINQETSAGECPATNTRFTHCRRRKSRHRIYRHRKTRQRNIRRRAARRRKSQRK